jgi:hypothetical protein
LEDKVQCSPRGCHPSGWEMAANTSGIYGSNRGDFGVSNHRGKLQMSDFWVFEQ